MTCKLAITMGKRFALTLSLFIMMAAPSFAADVYLVAGEFVQEMSDGRMVPMWGYAEADAGFTNVGPFMSPGPCIMVPPGDTTLNIHLRNTLTVDTSVVILGQLGELNPQRTGGRITSFTDTTAPNTDRTYSYTVKPGTYLYETGTHQAVQVEMGLYGMLTIDHAAGEAYPGVFYDSEVKILYSEVDPELHDAIDDGSYGTTGPTSTIDYTPQYFLVNGKEFAPGDPAIPAGVTNTAVLLRLANAGLTPHVPQLLGAEMHVVAEDGNPLTYAQTTYSTLLAAQKTKDAIWNLNPTPVGVYPFYDRVLDLTGAGSMGTGLLTKLAVTDCVPCNPSAELQDDVRCREGDPNQNFDDDTLQADDKSGKIFYKYAILKINLNDTQGAIDDLRLRLTVSGSSDNAGQMRLLTPSDCTAFANLGGESAATYANTVAFVQNAGAPQDSDTAGSVSPGDKVEFDLLALGINSDGMHCVAITTPSSDSVKYYSKDASTSASNLPELILSTTCTECLAPTTTTTTTLGGTTSTTSTTTTTSTTVTTVDPPSTTSTTTTTTSSTTSTTNVGSCNPAVEIQEDVRCRESDADANLNDDTLEADRSSAKHSILKINVSDTLGSITDLRLRLTVSGSSDSAGQIRLLSNADCQTFINNGGETWATYNNTVGFLAGAVAGPIDSNTSGSVSSGDKVEFDLDALGITSDGMYCVAITSTSKDSVKYESTEASTASKRPELLLTASCTSSTGSPTTTTLNGTTTTLNGTTTTSTTNTTSTTGAPTSTTTTTLNGGSCNPMIELQDDIRCREHDPDANLDDETVEADHKSGKLFYKFSILKLNVTGTLGSITDLRLRLTVSGASDNAGQIRLLSNADCQTFVNNGGESGATYNNSVGLLAGAVAGPNNSDTSGSVSRGDKVEFDLDALGITGDGMYCVAITSPSSDAVKFYSKDASTSASKLPELIMSTNCIE